jgi:sulfur carrier protein
MQLTINGRSVDLDGEMRVADYLQARGIDAKHIAVAVNGEVLPRGSYGEVLLRPGDVVEIVRMVGGG